MEEKTKFYTDAGRKATNKYRQKGAQITLYMSKEQKDEITQRATEAGQSVNQYVLSKIF